MIHFIKPRQKIKKNGYNTIYLHIGPTKVHTNLRQTFPFGYRFGLNLTDPPPVVMSLTRGGL